MSSVIYPSTYLSVCEIVLWIKQIKELLPTPHHTVPTPQTNVNKTPVIPTVKITQATSLALVAGRVLNADEPVVTARRSSVWWQRWDVSVMSLALSLLWHGCYMGLLEGFDTLGWINVIISISTLKVLMSSHYTIYVCHPKCNHYKYYLY